MATVLPALFVVASWWASTLAVLVVDGLPRATSRYSLAAATVLALGGGYGLYATARVDSPAAAYGAFACALAVWAWHELTFLLGVVTGPRKEPCPTDARGWRRFAYATLAIIHHELALAATTVAVALLTAGAPNQVGRDAFLVLWVMRLSAKLNVFLGVRNLATDFIPAHLRYLVTYFRQSRLNPLMPLSLVGGAAAAVWLASRGALAHTLTATLLGLAVVEHLFLALPLPDAALWRWAVRRR